VNREKKMHALAHKTIEYNQTHHELFNLTTINIESYNNYNY